MRKPVIGITLNWYRNREPDVRSYGKWLFGLNQTYARLIGSVDAFAAGIVPAGNEYGSIIDSCDIIILTGGGDPDPELYHRINNGSLSIRRERPLWEIGLYRAAREREISVFGICLGMQLISIAEDVPLIQDVPTQISNPLDHYGKPHNPQKHRVSLIQNTVLSSILGTEAEVSSFHHQAVTSIPAGFRLAARSSDGVIEAMESEDGKVIAVQWHPERDSTGKPILKHLVSHSCQDRLKR